MARKGRGKGSVLSRQKPKKARRKGAPLPLWRKALLGLAGVLIIAGVYGVWSWSKRLSGPSDKAPDWTVTLKVDGEQPLPDKAADAILAAVKKHIGKGTRDDLRRAAKAAQQTEAYARIHVLKLASGEVVVNVRPRTPLLCLEADKLRLVSADGSVFGTPDGGRADACPGPVLKGLFEQGRTRFTLKEDFTLALDADETTALKEGLELLDGAKAQGLKLGAIEFRKFRGFFVTLQGNETEVAVGRAPFPGKLQKLQGILQKLSEKGEVAVRIELDYQGKAFIKLKKM